MESQKPEILIAVLFVKLLHLARTQHHCIIFSSIYAFPSCNSSHIVSSFTYSAQILQDTSVPIH
jgi:hypothetical protein